ncbi:MAG: Carboxyl-terminal protease [Berkelbacteria bacterium GW2011_GWB1_38_5]|uniref:Carboxyl-terminal protease n=1 Tax=Berkelbacteria bacterium GW2011_GWB1_38_5 TaxID=1618336 RepID=A0A0G0K481_9BACT|nr:MAG: Carboxyl-terminal protease [Berkelbacteria bacterium GW2011_GWB1_38_5]
MKILSKIIKILGVLWIAVAFYFVGYLVGHKNIVFEKNYSPKVVNLDLGRPKEVDFSIFWDAWKIVTEKYVGKYDPQKLVYGAIKGMVEALGDPYSGFMEPGNSKQFLEDLSGEIQGIGAELSKKDSQLIIISPLSSSPAEKAGLKAKDQILKIDGQDTADMDLDTAISKIRGKAGTEVTLLIYRDGFTEPKEFKIKRDIIVIKSVKWEQKGEIGYIEISQFGEDTSALAIKAVNELKNKNLKAIILDLRNNPGGYLDVSVDVASLFMDGGVVVKEQYKDGRIEELKTTQKGELSKIKVIVLVNEGTASASEIVAGALRDSRNATIIGKKTFGKGSVQELESLQQNAALRITVAKWLTPSGKTIDQEGIKPDIEVDLTEADMAAGKDPQLDRALEEANK